MKIVLEHLWFLVLLACSMTMAQVYSGDCKYSCRPNGGCDVRYVGPPRSGRSKGSCGGSPPVCGGTPPECRQCNQAITCNSNSGNGPIIIYGNKPGVNVPTILRGPTTRRRNKYGERCGTYRGRNDGDCVSGLICTKLGGRNAPGRCDFIRGTSEEGKNPPGGGKYDSNGCKPGYKIRYDAGGDCCDTTNRYSYCCHSPWSEEGTFCANK